MAEIDNTGHLYLVDGSAYVFRAFYALPALTRRDGLPTGAVSGFSNMLWRLMRGMRGQYMPTHMAVVFDTGRPTFRHDIFHQYKGQRPELPDDLKRQFPLVRDAARAFALPCVEASGYEADDLIATYARVAAERGANVTIASSDKDMMQLIVPGQVEMFDPMKERRLGLEDVRQKFGVAPNLVTDVQALAGDSADNVPGVRGIGVKTAADLISTYGNLENVLRNAHAIKQPKRRDALMNEADNARMSLKLVTLDRHADMAGADEGLDAFTLRDNDYAALLQFLDEMELVTLARTVREASSRTRNRASGE